ncbi:hypothetical protein D5281_15880 [bacterium 1xD42-62]|uniref:Uncharacterized protein n=1 Tax=Parablautia muri TaxID=2320879 RepID=A0A9X5BHT9_9FIRM|nr:hypothetical protein [Parablautia muri]
MQTKNKKTFHKIIYFTKCKKKEIIANKCKYYKNAKETILQTTKKINYVFYFYIFYLYFK